MKRLEHALLLAFLCACQADECPSGARKCVGNVAQTCTYKVDDEFTGHLEWERHDCTTRTCLVPPEEVDSPAFCALDSSLDPACPASLKRRNDVSRCVGNSAVTWTFGYRVDQVDCAEGTFCIDVTNPEFDSRCGDLAFCSPSVAPDPLCRPGVLTLCEDDSTIVYCSCSFKTGSHKCESPGPSCVWISIADGIPAQGACR